MNDNDHGLSRLEQRVYRHLRRSSKADVAGLSAALGAEEYTVVIVVGRLVGLGLAEIDESGTVTVSQRPRPIDLLTAPERITDSEEVTRRIGAELKTNPAAEVRSVKASQRPRKLTEPSYTDTVFHLGRGTKYRTLVARHIIADGAVAAYFRALHRAGDVVRVSGDSLQTMTLLDDTRAFVPLEPGNPTTGALFLRDAGIVAALVALFDRAWIGAADLDLVAGDEVSTLDRRVLAALQDAAKDEAAARDLGMSVRTFRRHVADLMARLGAANRFQLAARAKERSWL